jgi:hypothetical protein
VPLYDARGLLRFFLTIRVIFPIYISSLDLLCGNGRRPPFVRPLPVFCSPILLWQPNRPLRVEIFSVNDVREGRVADDDGLDAPIAERAHFKSAKTRKAR